MLSSGNNWPLYPDIMQYARGELESLADSIKERAPKWSNGAQGDQVVNNVRSSTLQTSTLAGSVPEKHGERQEEPLDSHATQKAPQEWKQIQDIVEEILPDLIWGYIRLAVFERYERLPRDPDGFCSHIDTSRPQDTEAEPVLIEEVELLPRNS